MATNQIDSLDPALIRPGRIDRKIEFPLPDIKTTNASFHLSLIGSFNLLKTSSGVSEAIMNASYALNSSPYCFATGHITF